MSTMQQTDVDASERERGAPRPLRHDDLWAIAIPSDPQLSPDGRQVAYVVTTADQERDDYYSRIWIVPAAGGEPRLLTFGPRDLSPRWSPDGSRLAFLSSGQIHVWPLDGGEPTRLTDLRDGAGEPVWSPDGAHVAFAAATHLDGDAADDSQPVVTSRLGYKADGAGLLKELRTHLFVAEAAPEQVAGAPAGARQLTFGDSSASRPVWSPDGSRLAFTSSQGPERDLVVASVVHVVPAAGGEPVALSPARGVYQVADWSPDGETILVVGQERLTAGNDNLCALPAAGGRPVRLSPRYDRAVVGGMMAARGSMPRYVEGGARVLFCASDGGSVHVLEIPADGGEPSFVVGGERTVTGVSAAAGRLAFVVADAASPGEVWIKDGRERPLSRLFASALPEVGLLARTPLRFRAPDGTELRGWTLGEDVRSARPLLIDVHGGPQDAWGPAFDSTYLYHQTLAAAGWIVLTVNPRGSDGYGDAFRTAIVGAWGHTEEGDLLAAVDELVERGVADPARLCVSGYSYGGYMTCWLTARHDRFAAAVAGACVTDLVSMLGTSDIGPLLASAELDASVVDGREALVRSSPLTYVSGVRTPTLIMHGEADHRATIGQSEQWFSALREQEVPVQFVRYPDQDHQLPLNGRPSHRLDYGRRLEAWLTDWTDTVTPRPTV
jgi:dipeptidyl aminopeptidase/acylaminoacyl peptidase